MAFWAAAGWGETGAPVRRSGKTEGPRSRNGLLIVVGGPMMAGCHMELVAAVAPGWLDPSTMTSLMPLWLVVLMAEGELLSTAFSLGLLNDMFCSNPVNQSKLSSKCWLPDTSFMPVPKGDMGSRAIE